MVTSGYLDAFSISNPTQPLLAQRARLNYENYTVVFDLEVLPDSPAKSMKFKIF